MPQRTDVLLEALRVALNARPGDPAAKTKLQDALDDYVKDAIIEYLNEGDQRLIQALKRQLS